MNLETQGDAIEFEINEQMQSEPDDDNSGFEILDQMYSEPKPATIEF